MTTRESMIQHIHGINKALTKEWLEQQTNDVLLANCHPFDREKYATELKYGKGTKNGK